MKKNKPKEKKNGNNIHKITIVEIASLSLSMIAIFISIIFFVLPLSKSNLVIDDPGNIYFTSNQNKDYDQVIIPLIFSNYGSFVRSVYKVESYITYNDKLIPIKPYYIYDNINEEMNEINKTLFSSYIIHPNDGVKIIVGFNFDKTNFTKIDKIPKSFHFEPNQTYTINMRFYTTQNSFFGKKTQIIQVVYGFETKKDIDSNKINVSEQTFFKLNDSHTFDY